MEINIYINCKKTDSLFKAGIDEYIKRVSPYCRINLICTKNIPEGNVKKNIYNMEIVYGSETIRTVSSEEFADKIKNLMINGISRICFYIGYEDTPFDSFSITSPHMSASLTSVVLCEQIYRAFAIMNNITYHK